MDSASLGDAKLQAPRGQAIARRSGPRFMVLGLILVELLLLLVMARGFGIENPAFRRLLWICAAGSLLNYVLPPRLRLPFFSLLSLGCILVLLGPVHGGSLILVGCALIGLAHLPVPFPLRVGLMLLAAGCLAVLRADLLTPPWSPAIWPILGSMFMFRMMVYMYDLNNRAAPFSVFRAIGYFFMAPNVSFPLFPVVDYKTFCRSHYDDDALRVYQSGVEWILRGMVQLLVYRLVYHHLAIEVSGVVTAVDAMRFLVAGYALYLKISGSFHVVVGILHLFGFNLPLTNRNYFLAAGFTDYWRRINIYWKDFLQKIVFNPLYFRFNARMPAVAALSAATGIAFVATWALHSWQWFWIRGSFPIRTQDIAFWSAMGLLVLGNMLYENQFGRRRSLGRGKQAWRVELERALMTVATFATICVLWSIWSTESLGDFGLVMSRLARFDAVAAAWLAAGVALLMGLSVLLMRQEQRELRRGRLPKAKLPASGPATVAWGRPLRVAAVCVAVLVIRYGSHPLVQRYSPWDLSPPPAVATVLESLRGSQLSRWDAEKLDRGYYEDLTNVVNFNSQLSDLYAQRPPDWNRNPAEVEVEAFPPRELVASAAVRFKEATFTTNRWGMRDRDYEKTKPAGTWRIAVLGESNTMGQGVEDDETFENLVEERLDQLPIEGASRCEVLNFALADCGPVAKTVTLERALGFEPDVVLYVAVSELFWLVKELVSAAQEGRPLPDPYLTAAVAELGLDAGTPRAEAVQRLQSRREELLGWIYRRIAERCRESGVRPLMAFLPLPREFSQERATDLAIEQRLAQEAGIKTVPILDAFEGVDLKTLWVRPWDSHLNRTGHELLADRLEAGLRASVQVGPGAASGGDS